MSAFVFAAAPGQKGSEAFESASRYLSELDKAMANAVAVLQGGDLAVVNAQSKRFTALATEGKNQFGGSVFEPLGSCGAAGVFAQSWWTSQLAAATKGGKESSPGAIKGALESYQSSRAQCLTDAQPASAQDAKGGDGNCLTTYALDPKTQELVEVPLPKDCKTKI
ncbi:hypothetical protein LOY67_17435 [Pseudomonas sp. B21-056]|uniref:hypothetical protein n=1 Tax=Pseudomonas sp. B21-056 TaxID=2895495 RepID=UPI00222EBE55|nr:hypothetical protein [Pseudomonas sp. B21-056]UZE21829.1 hypothetical protein LOY67_17435 [Pseudomonas sp. B21-056]